jgi:molecular chaperone GrpE
VQAATVASNPELEQAQAKAEENWNLYLRTRAELENLRRRNERELENVQKFALERLISELLPVRDSLEMGMQAATAEEVDLAALREGQRLTLRQFSSVLEKFGVSEINPQGEKFNPDWHEAVSVVQAPQAEADTVVAVMQKGYALNGRLIRPAMVVVAKPG